ncbi:MAG: phage gp6-like head-tail connector protein [Clostridiales bacterium]|nr:phage gp6-like head-tail connector protein [Clostridiales bacterium]
MLERVKLALLITGNDFDSELNDLIQAAAKDLGIAGVDALVISTDTDDALLIRAVITYCGYQFELMHGSMDRSDAFKKSYDEQKAQMGMASGYTTWSNS